jgi:peroxiredoxin family protein
VWPTRPHSPWPLSFARSGDEADVFHTFFGIAGLSLLKSDGVLPIDPTYALPVRTMTRLREQQQQQKQQQQQQQQASGVVPE